MRSSTRFRWRGLTDSRCEPIVMRRIPVRVNLGGGDATSRAVRLALMAKTGEMGYPSALTAKTQGFYDVSFKGEAFRFQRPYGSYVMENVLFKISFPAEFHSQTAVEAAMTLHEKLLAAGKTAADIEKVTIRTHEACIRIIDKKARWITRRIATTASSTWWRSQRCSDA